MKNLVYLMFFGTLCQSAPQFGKLNQGTIKTAAQLKEVCETQIENARWINNKCYFFYDKEVASFDDSQKICSDTFKQHGCENGRLYEPRDSENFVQIYKLAEEFSEYPKIQLWLGLNDKAKENEFVHSSNGKLSKINAPWAESQPNGGLAENCLTTFIPDNGTSPKWYDRPCVETNDSIGKPGHKFMCECTAPYLFDPDQKQNPQGRNGGNVPEAVEKLYNNILSNLGTYGRNLTAISEVFANEWTYRPNPVRAITKGLFQELFQEDIRILMDFLAKMMPDMKYEMLQTFVTGNTVAVVSKISGTIAGVPPGFSDFPMFPGTDPERLKGKSFNSMAIDIHKIDAEGKIRRTWHVEDWTLALDQMLGYDRVAGFDLPDVDKGATLKNVPQCIYDFYDNILSDPYGGGQNNALLKATMHEDSIVRPGFSSFEISGIQGLRLITKYFGSVMPNIKYKRIYEWLHEDMVVVLSKVSATVTGAPRGVKEILSFPGINPQDLTGEKFETLGISIHRIVDGKIKQTYHIDEWQLAVRQMLFDAPVQDFGFDQIGFDEANEGSK